MKQAIDRSLRVSSFAIHDFKKKSGGRAARRRRRRRSGGQKIVGIEVGRIYADDEDGSVPERDERAIVAVFDGATCRAQVRNGQGRERGRIERPLSVLPALTQRTRLVPAEFRSANPLPPLPHASSVGDEKRPARDIHDGHLPRHGERDGRRRNPL